MLVYHVGILEMRSVCIICRQSGGVLGRYPVSACCRHYVGILCKYDGAVLCCVVLRYCCGIMESYSVGMVEVLCRCIL